MQKEKLSEKNIELLSFKYAIAEKFVHSLFSGYLAKQGATVALFIGLLQVRLPSNDPLLLFLSDLVIVLFAVIAMGSNQMQYIKSTRDLGRHMVRLESQLTEAYEKFSKI